MTPDPNRDTNELKPCPFCGGEAVTCRDYPAGLESVYCRQCHASMFALTEPAAIALWNSRKPPEEAV
jgi:Lar family restriction alleviation protein